jgi:hypothetical protein
MDPKALYFGTVVWGQQYCNVFTNFCLPTLLSPRNIPAVAHRIPIVFSILTDVAGAAFFEIHPVIRKLRELARVEILRLDRVSDTSALLTPEQRPTLSKRTLSASGQKALIKRAQESDAAFALLCPDAIWSDGSFSRIVDLLEDGMRLISLPNPRLSWEGATPLLGQARKDWVLTLPPRDLSMLALHALHWSGQAMFWDAPRFLRMPSHIYWRSANVGFVAHCFHVHPAVAYQTAEVIDIPGTLDDQFVEGFPDDRTYYVTDSDEACNFTFSTQSEIGTQQGNGAASIDEVVAWARERTNRRHRQFFGFPAFFHCDGLTTPAWKPVVEQAQEVVSAIMAKLALPQGDSA